MSKQHIKSRTEDIVDPNTGRTLMQVRVDEVRDELSPKSLAIKMAEALDRASKAQADIEAFSEYSMFEMQQASKLRDILFQLRHGGRDGLRQINPKTGKPYRMNPANDYDEDAIEEEMNMRKERAQEFREKANEAKNIASQSRKEAEALRIQISRG